MEYQNDRSPPPPRAGPSVGPYAKTPIEFPDLTLHKQTGSEGNSVLSYQWYGIDGDRCWSGIHYPDLSKLEGQKRLTLAHWVSYSLQDEYKGRSWPQNVVLAIHFSPAELSVISDFDAIKTRVDLVQGTSFVTIFNPINKNCYDRSRNAHAVRIHIADTMLLAPDGGKKLDDLGDILGLEKLDLPTDHSKDQMQRFLKEQPEKFEAYAIRDAEIAARYLERIQKECRDLGLTDNYRPITIGGLAVRTFTTRLQQAGHNYDDIMGMRRGNQRTGVRRSSSTRTHNNIAAERHEDLAIRCYHGGRNECFLFGAFDEVFTDYDLEGAYSTALAAVVEPDYDNMFETKDPEDYTLGSNGLRDCEVEVSGDNTLSVLVSQG